MYCGFYFVEPIEFFFLISRSFASLIFNTCLGAGKDVGFTEGLSSFFKIVCESKLGGLSLTGDESPDDFIMGDPFCY